MDNINSSILVYILAICLGVVILRHIVVGPLFEGFDNQCDSNSVGHLYRTWGNGGISNAYVPESRIVPNSSIMNSRNTLVDQSECLDYAKQTCLDVRGHDRFMSCQEGQFEQCMNGKRRPIF